MFISNQPIIGGQVYTNNPNLNSNFYSCNLACQVGNIEIVQRMIEQDPSLLHQRDCEGQTLLFCCVAFNQLEIMDYLYQKDSSVLDQCRSDGQTLMHKAVSLSQYRIVQWLHQRNARLIYQTDHQQLTPLHLAAFREDIPLLQFFLEALKRNTQLIQQIAQGNCIRSLAFILEQGVDPNMTNPPLLQLAVEAGQEKNIYYLLQHGAKFDFLESFYDNLKPDEKKLEYCQNNLMIWLKVLDIKHPHIAFLFSNIGSIYVLLGNNMEAIEYLMTALKIREKILGENHSDTAGSYIDLAEVYQSSGDYTFALQYFKKGLNSYMRLGTVKNILSGICRDIAIAYEKLKNHTDAEKYHNMANEVESKILGDLLERGLFFN